MSTPNLAAIRERLAKTKAGLKRAGTTIKPKQGKNRYVILPPFNDLGEWSHNFGQHFVKDEADQIQAVYICSDRTHGTACPVCATMAEAQRTVGVHDKVVSEIVKKAYAQQQFLIGVLALDSDQPDVPQVLQIGKKAFEQLVVLVESWMEQVFDPTNPQIVTIDRAGTTQNDTTYTVQASPNRHTYKKAVKPIDLAEFVKQESEMAEKKAIGAVRAIAGLAGPSVARPALTAPSAGQFEDVPDFANTPAAAPVAAAPATAGPAITDDIDSMLDSIGA